MTCANVLLPVTVQMRCESRPAFLNAYLRLLSAGGSQGDSAGQVCAGVLVKLVMDMYLKATPAVAFPLTLVMLHRSAITL